MAKMNETDIQTACVRWFRAAHPEGICFHTPNEACNRRWTVYERQGVLKGAPDLTVVLAGVVFFVEMKTPKGRMRPEQVEFQRRCAELGVGYHVCRSIEEFREIVWSYLA